MIFILDTTYYHITDTQKGKSVALSHSELKKLIKKGSTVLKKGTDLRKKSTKKEKKGKKSSKKDDVSDTDQSLIISSSESEEES